MNKLLHLEIYDDSSKLNFNLRTYVNNQQYGSRAVHNINILNNSNLEEQINNCTSVNDNFVNLQNTYLSSWDASTEFDIEELQASQNKLISTTNDLLNEGNFLSNIQPLMLDCLLHQPLEKQAEVDSNPTLLVNAQDTQITYTKMFWQTPFNEWKLFNNSSRKLHEHYNTEIMFASSGLTPIDINAHEENNRSKVKIAIILGCAVTQSETESILNQSLNTLLIKRNVEIICFSPIQTNELNISTNNIQYFAYNQFSDLADRLSRIHWDILFFTSHSITTQTNDNNSILTASMEIEENNSINLFQHLRQSINKTYKPNKPRIIVMNSCDGLGFIPEINQNQIKISHVIVMRYPIPVKRAREFFQQFIENFITHQSLSSAMWHTREWLNEVEGDSQEIPGLTWLPVAFCANDIKSPFLTFNMLRSPQPSFWYRIVNLLQKGKNLFVNNRQNIDDFHSFYRFYPLLLRFLLGLQVSLILASVNQTHSVLQFIALTVLIVIIFGFILIPISTIISLVNQISIGQKISIAVLNIVLLFFIIPKLNLPAFFLRLGIVIIIIEAALVILFLIRKN